MTTERLLVLLYNAIVLLEENLEPEERIPYMERELGMTPEEYQEVMED